MQIKQKKKKILIIAAHPDDEVLGCGGTIAYLSDSGHEVNLLTLSDGVSSRNHTLKDIEDRKHALIESSKILGINKIFQEDFPDNKFEKSNNKLEILPSDTVLFL